MPFNVGPIELIIVLVIALLVVGPRRLPEMGNAVGKTIREFRKASTDITDAATLEPETKPATAVPPTPAAIVDPTPSPDPSMAPAPTSAAAPSASTEPASPTEATPSPAEPNTDDT